MAAGGHPHRQGVAQDSMTPCKWLCWHRGRSSACRCPSSTGSACNPTLLQSMHAQLQLQQPLRSGLSAASAALRAAFAFADSAAAVCLAASNLAFAACAAASVATAAVAACRAPCAD
eukprot:CAMPEP_0115558666 /NCGR_PEP_ID=MMETSP0271-20121206/99559_1 /TAXON_ID=71861 /ORGANISM="Scrippsiella trochoidea, Strain CCMP3099" /LENGTH=116 /DNA_ID=CAMNT_0002992695 /DNA_START=1163 /DNA_END=1513 /DNA_ORIENTATION=+